MESEESIPNNEVYKRSDERKGEEGQLATGVVAMARQEGKMESE